MTPTKIKNIISKGETTKVDFKREWYKKEELKGELVKDIFALANGSVLWFPNKIWEPVKKCYYSLN